MSRFKRQSRRQQRKNSANYFSKIWRRGTLAFFPTKKSNYFRKLYGCRNFKKFSTNNFSVRKIKKWPKIAKFGQKLWKIWKLKSMNTECLDPQSDQTNYVKISWMQKQASIQTASKSSPSIWKTLRKMDTNNLKLLFGKYALPMQNHFRLCDINEKNWKKLSLELIPNLTDREMNTWK